MKQLSKNSFPDWKFLLLNVFQFPELRVDPAQSERQISARRWSGGEETLQVTDLSLYRRYPLCLEWPQQLTLRGTIGGLISG